MRRGQSGKRHGVALVVFLSAVRRNPRIRSVRPREFVRHVLEGTNSADYLVHGRDLFD